MYDIRQFKPVLYVLLVLGISGFALAAQSPAIGFLAVTAIVVNAWLVKTRRFVPMPHWLATAITLLALVVLAAPLRADPSRAVLVIGQFLVALQLVKLYEQRANRDYAQLLVLSLLLVVAASINTASLLFGILLIAYLFLSLFCCLLFHLKVETDFARAAIGLPDDTQHPNTLRQDQRYLSRSMRRLTAVVSAVAITMAVLVFLLFPRGAGAGMLGPLQFKPSQTLSGFNDTVSFQKIAQISQNSEQIAWVKVWKDGQLMRGTEPLLLRGMALDIYTGDDATLGASRHWRRSPDENFREVEPGHDLRVVPDEPRWKQNITLSPTGTPVLFALPGLCRVNYLNGNDSRIRFWPHDQVIQCSDQINSRITYEVESNEVISNAPAEPSYYQTPDPPASNVQGGSTDHPQLQKSVYDPMIEQYARRVEVSGSDAQGPLAERRIKTAPPDPLDIVIAENISTYLRRNFTYTLDLTDAKDIGDRDPLVAFLYDFKRGHCEYFAGAMALMCQSLGMQARVVVGFRCDEYNPMLDQYIVRQSHAHAWVEVLDSTGIWHTFDPTSSRDAPVNPNSGVWRKTMQFMQYLQYTWANSVVAYDRDSRTNLLNNVDRTLSTTVATSNATASKMKSWLSEHTDAFASSATSALFIAMIVVLVAAVAWFLWERWQLRRRARRIGLDALPVSDKLRLLRQLGFYDELLLLLERHRVTRKPHMTPMEFSHSITFLPNEVYDAVRRLTDIFYRVRYGRHELSPAQQKHLSEVIADISAELAGKSRS